MDYYFLHPRSMIFNKINNKLASIAVMLIIVMIGVVQSHTTMGGDQSLFVVIAQQLDMGKVLYQDLFDYKQPGIYLFYLLAGNTIGWDDVSIHLFELGYWIIFTLVLFYTVKEYQLFRLQYFYSLLPLFIVGVYYCNARWLHLTQLEAIINFPIFLIVWLLDRAYKSKGNLFLAYFAIGLLVAIVLLSKLVFAPIIAAFFLIHFLFVLRVHNLGYIVRTQVLPLILGFALPASFFLFYIFHHHIETLVFEIYFKIPASVIGLTDQIDPERLQTSVKWFIKKMVVFLILAGVGVLMIRKIESHFLSLLLAWAVVGLFVVLMQKTSWWAYHFQLLYVPIGFFAAMGLDWILYRIFQFEIIKRARIENLLMIFVLIGIFYIQYHGLWKNHTATDVIKLNTYDYAQEEVASVLSVLKEGDTMFVCGNPRMYVLASRLPELSTNGWILEYYLDFQWQAFYTEFVESPPTYLFVKLDYDTLIQQKNKSLWEYIINNYSVFESLEHGTWFKKI